MNDNYLSCLPHNHESMNVNQYQLYCPIQVVLCYTKECHLDTLRFHSYMAIIFCHAHILPPHPLSRSGSSPFVQTGTRVSLFLPSQVDLHNT